MFQGCYYILYHKFIMITLLGWGWGGGGGGGVDHKAHMLTSPSVFPVDEFFKKNAWQLHQTV